MTDAEHKAQMAVLNQQWQTVRAKAKRRREERIHKRISQFDRAMYRAQQERKGGGRRAGRPGKK